MPCSLRSALAVLATAAPGVMRGIKNYVPMIARDQEFKGT